MTITAPELEKTIYTRPESLTSVQTHYCPGCTHGVAHRLVAEVLDEMGLREKTVGVASVGCSVFAYNYFEVDFVQAPHGRAPAMATGIKRVLPDRTVFTYQGDGDLAGIGTAETIHAANRGENITTIFINNAVYGMTGGQMAPTTLCGMKTTTTPYGRDHVIEGYPLRMSEMLAPLDGVAYIERVAISSPAGIRRMKKAVAKAFQTQIDNRGFSMVEILSPCPTNWKMTPAQSWKWVGEEMTQVFPLGVYKDVMEPKHVD